MAKGRPTIEGEEKRKSPVQTNLTEQEANALNYLINQYNGELLRVTRRSNVRLTLSDYIRALILEQLHYELSPEDKALFFSNPDNIIPSEFDDEGTTFDSKFGAFRKMRKTYPSRSKQQQYLSDLKK